MDLFSIVCTTCKSRLRVRDPAAIGQILACPRCGGMVMVKPPPHWSGETVRSDLSTATGLVSTPPPPDQTVSSSAFDAIEELLAEAPPRSGAPAAGPSAGRSSSPSQPLAGPAANGTRAAGRPPADGSPAEPSMGRSTADASASAPPARPRFVGAPPRAETGSGKKGPSGNPPQATAASPALQAAPNGVIASAIAPQQKPVASASDPALPPPPQEAASSVAAAANEAVRSVLPATPRFWLALGGSVGVGVLLAVVAVAGAIRLFYGSPGVAARKSTPSSQATSRAALPSAGTFAGPMPDTASPTADSASPGARPPEEQLDSALNVLAGGSVGAGVASDAQAPAMPPAAASSSEAVGTVGDRAARPAESAPALAPSSLLPRPAEGGGIETLAKFDRFLGGDETVGAASAPTSADSASATLASSASPASPPEGSAPVRPPETAEPAAEPRPIAPRPPPLAVDVPKRLADPLMLVQTSGTPLVEFLQLFSDLSTIPITLEPDALALVRLTPLSPVSIDASATTVGGALTSALRSLGLEAVTVEDQLVVRVIEPETLRTIEYPTKDLADDEAGREALAQLLQAVVEPSSWGEEQGQGSITVPANKAVLTIRQRQAVHAALFIACEKLRVARGKPPASTRYDAALFSLTSRSTRAAEKLQQRVTANFRQPTRLVTILRRLGEFSGLTILVDWQDIASLGWNPQAEASIVFDNQPLEDALDALLGPMDLAWRVVDAQTLQVVSPQRLATQGELEVYPVGPLVGDDPQGQQLLARVQATLGEETFVEAGGVGVVRYDPVGRCLLAWLPQPKQRQLEEGLQRWRAAQDAAPATDRRP